MRKTDTEQGFTLVELLVVIGIIALLISILIPVLNKARDAAVMLKCESNLRQIGIATQMYSSANRGVLVSCTPYTYASAGGLGNQARWWVLLGEQHYLKTIKGEFQYYQVETIPVLMCPATDLKSRRDANGYIGSPDYGMASWCGGEKIKTLKPSIGQYPKVGTFKDASRLVYIAEERFTATKTTNLNTFSKVGINMIPIEYPGDGNPWTSPGGPHGARYQTVQSGYYKDGRLGTKMSVLFVDSHVETPYRAELVKGLYLSHPTQRNDYARWVPPGYQ